MNMNFNVFKPYKDRLKGACDEFDQALYDSEVDQEEFATALADSAEATLDNYHEMQDLLKRHPELKDEPLFKNIEQQYEDLLRTDYDHDFTVDYYHNILADFAEQEKIMQKHGVDDGVKIERKAM